MRRKRHFPYRTYTTNPEHRNNKRQASTTCLHFLLPFIVHCPLSGYRPQKASVFYQKGGDRKVLSTIPWRLYTSPISRVPRHCKLNNKSATLFKIKFTHTVLSRILYTSIPSSSIRTQLHYSECFLHLIPPPSFYCRRKEEAV